VPYISASVRILEGSQGGERRAEFRGADLLREIDACGDCGASGANVVIRYAVRREMREFRIGLDDRGDLVADAVSRSCARTWKGRGGARGSSGSRAPARIASAFATAALARASQ
jgi:hypothetical protein